MKTLVRNSGTRTNFKEVVDGDYLTVGAWSSPSGYNVVVTLLDLDDPNEKEQGARLFMDLDEARGLLAKLKSVIDSIDSRKIEA